MKRILVVFTAVAVFGAGALALYRAGLLARVLSGFTTSSQAPSGTKTPTGTPTDQTAAPTGSG